MFIPRRYHAALLAALFLNFSATAAVAQPALDRVVGPWYADVPLIITDVTGMTIGALARAAGVPMGVEALSPGHAQTLKVRATGRTLRAVLDEITASDTRYEWREHDGVVVIRPVPAWAEPTHVLGRLVGPLRLEHAQANDALAALADVLGAAPMRGNGPDDTSRFQVALSAGTLLDALNGIVRAHGTMTWAVMPTANRGRLHPFTMALVVGSSGVGFGFAPDAVILHHPPNEGRPLPISDVVVPILDRIVGTRRGGEPVVLHSIRNLADVSAAVGVPIGLELLSPGEPQQSLLGITVTGVSLRNALSVVAEIDDRYEWREMEGVVVVRPKTAWIDSENPLFRVVNNVRLEHVAMSEAVGTVVSRLGSIRGQVDLSDTRRVSIDVPNGTLLDLLSAIARSHGALSWRFEQLGVTDRLGVSRHMLSFQFFGGWETGFTIE